MTDSHDLAAVEELLSERDALHGWLARLDQSGTTAPEAVRARVRRDYEARMQKVTDRLRVHADAVTEKLRADRREHAELSTRATAARDALAEAELRHAVGEFERSRFEAERSRYAEDIAACEHSVDEVAARIRNLEEVHGIITAAPGASAPRPAAVAEEPIEIDDLAPDAASVEAPFADVDVDFDDDEGELPPLVPPAQEFAPLSFRPTHGSEPARPAAPPMRASGPPLGMPADVPPRFVRTGETPAVPPPPPPPVETLFEQDIVVAGPVPDAPPAANAGRTLRCGECGAMNKPLEWYCEKCGAELTAV